MATPNYGYEKRQKELAKKKKKEDKLKEKSERKAQGAHSEFADPAVAEEGGATPADTTSPESGQ